MLSRHVTAEIARLGRFPDLEELLPTMTDLQMRDILTLIRAAREAGSRDMQRRARSRGYVL